MNRKMAFISGISGVKRDGEMKKNMMVFWICLLLGILSVIYAVMVHATGSGTAFFLIWIGIGIVVFLSMIFVITPPMVSTPRESGVTSSNSKP